MAGLALLAAPPGAFGATDLPPTRTTLDLIRAAQAGDLTRVRGLLQAGADPNVTDATWTTPLIVAARDGHLDMVRLLVDAGAVIDWQDREWLTPLILATQRNHPRVADFLLARGANPWLTDRWRRRALDYALRRGRADPIARRLAQTEVNWPRPQRPNETLKK